MSGLEQTPAGAVPIFPVPLPIGRVQRGIRAARFVVRPRLIVVLLLTVFLVLVALGALAYLLQYITAPSKAGVSPLEGGASSAPAGGASTDDPAAAPPNDLLSAGSP